MLFLYFSISKLSFSLPFYDDLDFNLTHLPSRRYKETSYLRIISKSFVFNCNVQIYKHTLTNLLLLSSTKSIFYLHMLPTSIRED